MGWPLVGPIGNQPCLRLVGENISVLRAKTASNYYVNLLGLPDASYDPWTGTACCLFGEDHYPLLPFSVETPIVAPAFTLGGLNRNKKNAVIITHYAGTG